MKINNTISIIIVCFLCFSCRFKPAPIENHRQDSYSKNNNYSSEKYTKKIKNPPIKESGSSQGQEIVIGAGETLYSISQKHNVNLRDLISENNLAAPYNLKTGSKIKIPKQTYYQVKATDTLYSISRQHQMNVNELVALNDLAPPYNITIGQKIKISKEKTAVISVSTGAKSESKSQSQASAPTQAQTKAGLVSEVLSNKTNRFGWPIKGAIISGFGPKKGGLYNDGINIKTTLGAEVKSTESGVVAYVGNELKGYGNLIILKHSGGWISAYGHLGKTSVSRGQKVEKAQTIAFAGASGNVDLPQLYFGLRKGRDAVNPEFYLKK